MLLNILLTRKCNYNCSFCIEKTKDDTQDNCSPETFLRKANHLIDKGLVHEVLLLGGEPLLYPHISSIVEGLHLPPIVTTNGSPLLDDSFLSTNFGKIRAVNLSIPHYDYGKRKEVIRSNCLSNEELEAIVRKIDIPIRMNTVLMRDYINSLEEVDKMIDFAKAVGIKSAKFGELTGVNESTHNFVDPEVLRYNQSQYCPIHISEMRELCHRLGGTHFYRNINGVDVFFNSAPDFAISGGKDKEGRYYHTVLFNDGMLGFSWKRADGVFEDEEQFLQLAQRNLS